MRDTPQIVAIKQRAVEEFLRGCSVVATINEFSARLRVEGTVGGHPMVRAVEVVHDLRRAAPDANLLRWRVDGLDEYVGQKIKESRRA